MWIIPSNLPLSSLSALEYLGSSEGLKELASIPVSWPTWKSKPTSLQTWLRAWKRVYWIPHLFGRTLKPSMHRLFVEEYTVSLAVIHVRPSVSREQDQAKTIPDTFTRLYQKQLRQPDLFGASSKMSQRTSHWDSTKFTKTYNGWVMQLRQESTQRRKLARHMREKGCLSSHWTTPVASDLNRNTKYQQGGTALSLQIKNWSTPRASPNENRQTKSTPSQEAGTHGRNLASDVNRWPTAASRDWKDSGYELAAQDRNSPCLPASVILNSPLDLDNRNTDGKNRAQLNPAWVAQLMGTTLEKIFFVPLATAWSSKQQN